MKKLLIHCSVVLIQLVSLRVYAIPIIKIQPVDKTVCAGGSTFFSIVDSSACASIYQWQVQTGAMWINISNLGIYSGATTDTLWFTSVPVAYNGTYVRCNIITATCGSVISDSVKLVVNTVPVITIQPTDGVYIGDLSFLNVSATGGNVSYQWRYNNANLGTTGPGGYLSNLGVNSDTLFIQLNSMLCGMYCSNFVSGPYKCVVSNSCGTDTSQPVFSYLHYYKWVGTSNSSWNDTANWKSNYLLVNTWGPTSVSYINYPINSVPVRQMIYISPNATYSPITSGRVAIDILTIPTGKTISMNSNSDTIFIGGFRNFSGIYNGSKGTTITMYCVYCPVISNYLPSGNYYRVNFGSPYPAFDVASFGGGTSIITGNIYSDIQVVINGGDLIIDTTATFNIPSLYTPIGGRLVLRNIGGTNRTGAIGLPLTTIRGMGTPNNAQLSINNNGTPDEFRVRVIDSVTNNYSGNTPIGSKINSNAVGKTWFIEEGTPGGSNVTLTLSWDSVSEKTGFSRNNSYIANYQSSGWFAGSTSSSVLSNGLYTKTVTGLSSFGIFGIGSNGTLPLHLLSFKGLLINGMSQLEWETGSEMNKTYFNVLRSTDNKNFSNIGTVEGAVAIGISRFDFTDKESIELIKIYKTVYYRIQLVESNGSQELNSETIAITADDIHQNEISFEPNPFSESTYLKIESSTPIEKVQVSVYDISGVLILSKEVQQLDGENNMMFQETSLLHTGLYFVRVEFGNQFQYLKLVKR